MAHLLPGWIPQDLWDSSPFAVRVYDFVTIKPTHTTEKGLGGVSETITWFWTWASWSGLQSVLSDALLWGAQLPVQEGPSRILCEEVPYILKVMGEMLSPGFAGEVLRDRVFLLSSFSEGGKPPGRDDSSSDGGSAKSGIVMID